MTPIGIVVGLGIRLLLAFNELNRTLNFSRAPSVRFRKIVYPSSGADYLPMFLIRSTGPLLHRWNPSSLKRQVESGGVRKGWKAKRALDPCGERPYPVGHEQLDDVDTAASIFQAGPVYGPFPPAFQEAVPRLHTIIDRCRSGGDPGDRIDHGPFAFVPHPSRLHHRRRHRFRVGGLRLVGNCADILGSPLLGLYVLIIRRHCRSPFQEEVAAVDMVPAMGWRTTYA